MSPHAVTTPPLTRAITAVDRQIVVGAVVCNDTIPPGQIALIASWPDIAAHLLHEVRMATARTFLELEHLAHSIAVRPLFDDPPTKDARP